MPDQPIRELGDLRALKVLAHPLRNQVFEHLRLHGPATSASLARDLDVNTGATSYALRMLASHGFVEEVPERGRGRERWWQAVRRDYRLPPPGQRDPAQRAMVDEMQRLGLAADLDMLAAFQQQRPAMGEWADATPFSRSSIRVTLAELEEFFEEYLALVRRYMRTDEEAPEGSRTVVTRLLAFPAPDTEGDGDEPPSG
ncbi:helix-turn-helix domain-containing protein [Actinopolymorpha pittospori]|uniref:DNA-binding transcriptional ArsR family regulator n=1 Tax=Actinopolymorpha pittospori TaxID=648752 RepID=A0A927MXG7_9ACTN|nr:DNA-binding transcriptional ArsR family regulator [Actinopolymorpha pittospori]